MPERALTPLPPFEAAIDTTVQFWTTSFMAILATTALLYSLLHWRRSGKPTFLLLFLSGGAMMAFEPLVDTVGACWFPEKNAWIAFHAYGRPLPVWLCLVYFVYFGIGVGAVWQLMRRGLDRSQLWRLFIGCLLADFVLEAVLLHFDTYTYYGWQPLVVLRFPLWWAPVNALVTMVAAALVYGYEDYLTQGWRQLQIVPVALSASAAVNAMAGWPSWLVINTDLGPLATQLGGVATFVLSAWFMWMVAELTAKDASELRRPRARIASAVA